MTSKPRPGRAAAPKRKSRAAVRFTPAVAGRICERVAVSKESLRTICAAPGFPTVSTMMRWLQEKPAFRESYARAKQIQAELLIEEIIEIADDGRNDTFTNTKGTASIDHDVIQRSKLRVDTRKWLAAKLLPKKYGEKVELEVEHSGRVDSHIVLTEARRAELLERRRAAVALANPDRPAQTGRATAGASTGAMGKGK